MRYDKFNIMLFIFYGMINCSQEVTYPVSHAEKWNIHILITYAQKVFNVVNPYLGSTIIWEII